MTVISLLSLQRALPLLPFLTPPALAVYRFSEPVCIGDLPPANYRTDHDGHAFSAWPSVAPYSRDGFDDNTDLCSSENVGCFCMNDSLLCDFVQAVEQQNLWNAFYTFCEARCRCLPRQGDREQCNLETHDSCGSLASELSDTAGSDASGSKSSSSQADVAPGAQRGASTQSQPTCPVGLRGRHCTSSWQCGGDAGDDGCYCGVTDNPKPRMFRPSCMAPVPMHHRPGWAAQHSGAGGGRRRARRNELSG